MMETDELATDIGSVIGGEEAVKSGLIDNMGNISDAMKNWLRNIFKPIFYYWDVIIYFKFYI